MLTEQPLRQQSRFVRTFDVLKVVWTLGDVVRKLRSDRGWTQAELGAEADLHQTAINRLEKNSNKSERTTIERTATALRVSVADLYAYAEELSLAAELTESERRYLTKTARQLIERRLRKTTEGTAQNPGPSPGLQAPVRESPEPVQKRRQR